MSQNRIVFKKFNKIKYLNRNTKGLKNKINSIELEKERLFKLLDEYNNSLKDLYEQLNDHNLDDRVWDERFLLRQINKNNKPNKNNTLPVLKVGSWIRCTKCGINTKDTYKAIKTTCKPCHRELRKDHYSKNKKKTKKAVRNWQKRNMKKVVKYVSKYQKKNPDKFRESQKKWQSKKRKTCIKYRTAQLLRGRIRDALKSKKWTKRFSLKEYIGCSKDDLVKHLESQFIDNMTWDNQGQWHIDHIIPLSSAETVEEMYKLCHYTNLQPLWAKDNIKKGAKLPHELD